MQSTLRSTFTTMKRITEQVPEDCPFKFRILDLNENFEVIEILMPQKVAEYSKDAGITKTDLFKKFQEEYNTVYEQISDFLAAEDEE